MPRHLRLSTYSESQAIAINRVRFKAFRGNVHQDSSDALSKNAAFGHHEDTLVPHAEVAFSPLKPSSALNKPICYKAIFYFIFAGRIK